MSSKKHNPVIVTAQKHIPAQKRWIENSAKWIKAHKMTISLTVEGILTLYALYSAAQNSKDVKEINEIKDKNFEKLYFETRHKAGYSIAEVDRRLGDPRFRQYLKKYHKITDLKPLYKLKLRREEDY